MIFNKFQRKQAHAKVDEILDSEKRVNITEFKEKRTITQNSLMWLWLACIQQETGNDKDYMHEFFKEMYLGYDVKEVFGKEQRRLRSTTDLNTKQFTDYLDKIHLFALENGITLLDPKDKHFAEFLETYKDYV